MPDTEDEGKPRDFASFLLDLPHAHAEASRKLVDVVAGVRDTRKVGVLTVKFQIKPSENDDDKISVSPDVTATIPKHTLKGGVFFPDEHNNITKDDPAMLWRDDDLRPAPGTTVDFSTGEVKEAPKR